MFRRRLDRFSMFALVAVAPLATAVVAGCREQHASPTSTQPPSLPTPVSSASASAASSAAAPSASVAAASALDAGAYEGPWIGATVMQAPISSEMEYPSDKPPGADGKPRAVRLGTLRYGEKAPVIPEPHKKANCPEGWYELLAGGFVCGKYTTLDMDHPRFKLVKAPDLVNALPYTYGVNVQHGTPIYRQVPSREERLKLEPWLAARPRKAKTDDDGNPYAAAAVTSAPDAGASDIGEGAGGGEKPDAPWWQRDAADAGAPAVTLEDLQESDGPIARRMVKGFFLSLDHQFGSGGSMWWKTMSGLVVPADRIFVSKPVTEFHGLWLGRDGATFATKNTPSRRIDKLPVGFVLNGRAKKWSLDAAHKHATQAEGLIDRFEAVGLTGETAALSDGEYWETDEGWWLKASDGTKTEPGPPPEKLGEHEKWIDVNQHRQVLVAFEGSDARVRHALLERAQRARDRHRLVPHPREAHRLDHGRRRRHGCRRRALLDRGRALHPVLQRRLRASRSVLARRVRPREEPRLREPRAVGRQGHLRLDRSPAARGVALGHGHEGPSRHARGRARAGAGDVPRAEARRLPLNPPPAVILRPKAEGPHA